MAADGGRAGAAAAVASIATPIERLRASAPPRTAPSVGIVGAGLAGLACADALADRGIVASVYEAGLRTGGRCLSLRGFFPQQVGERGGEFIDTTHKTMLGYAKRFGLALEDVTKKAGDTTYFFDGQFVPEAVIVDELREFVTVMRADLRRLSSEVTASSPTVDDVMLDNTSLRLTWTATIPRAWRQDRWRAPRSRRRIWASMGWSPASRAVSTS